MARDAPFIQFLYLASLHTYSRPYFDSYVSLMKYSRQSAPIHYLSIYYMTFGTFLLNLRHEHKLSQNDVAAAVNVAQSTYCDWESDKHLPKIAYFRPLSILFKVKEEVLLQRIYGQNAATETELQRLKIENEHLRQRDAQREETIQVLQNSLKKLSQNSPSNGETNGSTVGGVIY